MLRPRPPLLIATAASVAALGCLAGEPTSTGESGDHVGAGDAGAGQTADASAPSDGAPADAGEDAWGDAGDAVWACDPTFELDRERYEAFEGLSGQALATALAEFATSAHDPRGYDPARAFLFEELEVRDHGKLECVYTDDRVAPDGTNLPGDEFNTEHVWPRSRGADDHPERSDLHHLFAVEIDANSRRANHEFGHVACTEETCDWHRDGSFLGPSEGDPRDPVFEVQPERRGDIARAILYFSLRYDHAVSPEEEAVLRAWNCDDPPSDYERARNDDIEGFQGNRNPLIDRPDFVDRIDRF